MRTETENCSEQEKSALDRKNKKTLYTGHVGDGKIFVYNVQQVVKVRTGEENLEALKDVE